MRVIGVRRDKRDGWRPAPLSIYGQLLASVEDSHPGQALEMTVRRVVEEGYQRELILLELDIIRSQLQQWNRGSQADVVMDIMDRMTGDCAPNQTL